MDYYRTLIGGFLNPDSAQSSGSFDENGTPALSPQTSGGGQQRRNNPPVASRAQQFTPTTDASSDELQQEAASRQQAATAVSAQQRAGWAGWIPEWARAWAIAGDDSCPREHALSKSTRSTTSPESTGSLERQWRLSLYRALVERGTKMLWRNRCNLSDIFQPGTVRVLTSKEKNSASRSVILMGALQEPNLMIPEARMMRSDIENARKIEALRDIWLRIKCDVVIKVSFPRLDDPSGAGRVAALESEERLYRFMGQLVDVFVTPNLVVGLAQWRCQLSALSATLGVDQVAAQQLRDAMSALYAQQSLVVKASDPLRFVVLERGRGDSLGNMLLSNSINETQLLSIVFQTLYTLDCLNRRFVRHGDLHVGNVFVDRLSEPSTTLAYLPYFSAYHSSGGADGSTATTTSDLWFNVPTYGFVPKLYDWDFGGIYEPSKQVQAWPLPSDAIVNETAQRFCNVASTCGHNSKADAFTLLMTLYDISATQQFTRFRAFVERAIDPRLLQFASVRNPGGSGFKRRSGFEEDSVGGTRYRLCKGPLKSDTASCTSSGGSGNLFTGQPCSGPWEPNDCLMQTPAQMMLDDIFVPYRRSRAADRIQTPYLYGDWPSQTEYERTIPERDQTNFPPQ